MMSEAHFFYSLPLLLIWIRCPRVYDWGLLGLTGPREADEQRIEQDGKHLIALRA